MVVLLIGDGEMYEMTRLTEAVESSGGTAFNLDVSEWPHGPPITVDPSTSRTQIGGSLDIANVSAVYVDYNNLFTPFDSTFRSQAESDFYSTFFQFREFRGLFEGVLRSISYHGGKVVPPLHLASLHDRKSWQLRRLRYTDVPTPPTVFTTDPDAAEAFCREHGDVIYKPITNGGLPTKISHRDLTEEKMEVLSTAPVQFQAYVPGEDIRVYVLEGEVVGAVRYDSRAYSYKIDIHEDDGEQLEYSRANISKELSTDAVRAAEAVGLSFAAVDVRRPRDEPHRVLEVNDTPRFAVAERHLERSVAAKLAEYLLK